MASSRLLSLSMCGAFFLGTSLLKVGEPCDCLTVGFRGLLASMISGPMSLVHLDMLLLLASVTGFGGKCDPTSCSSCCVECLMVGIGFLRSMTLPCPPHSVCPWLYYDITLPSRLTYIQETLYLIHPMNMSRK